MKLKIIPTSSPNFDASPINARFALIHYTACDLETTLKIFADPQKRVSCHYLISVAGDIYEPVGQKNGKFLRAWHAGRGFLPGGKEVVNLNESCIGIELENTNGNIFSYEEKQYKALFQLAEKIITDFPDLNSPDRWFGHEHFCGYRGKCDPGHLFNWERFFFNVFGPGHNQIRKPVLSGKALPVLRKLYETTAISGSPTAQMLLSSLTETLLGVRHADS